MQHTDHADARARQEELGQFLTPPPLADFLASLFSPLPASVRLLDAGAGAGALTLAFVTRCCEKLDRVNAIEATLYERDPHILGDLAATMRECARRCEKVGIQFASRTHSGDFVEEMSSRLAGSLFETAPPCFDAAIVTPPYRKISTDSVERRALRRIGIETSNLYTGFLAVIHRLLVPGGQLVAITPRSFCNGPYFRPFREDFLRQMELHRLHVFDSRQAAFRGDSVLQENVVFHAVKGRRQPDRLTISTSSGEHGASVADTTVPFSDVVHPSDVERFIHIPTAESHSIARDTLSHLRASLASLGLSVSTGPVVDFRLKDALRMEPEPGTVPMLYPCHFNGGSVHWPKRDARKPNAILDTPETHRWLVPAGRYLLTKRFTSKEERRRLVACVLNPENVKGEWIGIENHLNYLHANGHGLERDLAAGLYAFLSSTPVDQYFRRFSGHTQVNAADLRKLAYPELEILQEMGHQMATLDLTQDEIDQLVSRHLNAS